MLISPTYSLAAVDSDPQSSTPMDWDKVESSPGAKDDIFAPESDGGESPEKLTDTEVEEMETPGLVSQPPYLLPFIAVCWIYTPQIQIFSM